MLRISAIAASVAALLVLPGCLEKEAADPHAFLREETVNRVGPASRATSRTVRCGCDADGGLHLRTPQGSRVTVPEDDNPAYVSEAEVVLPDDAPAYRRTSKSLGFIGDSKLTPGRSHGGPWNVPDALLPPHRHLTPSYGYSGYPVRSYRYAYPGGVWYQ
jgi:hypothetical protein